MPVIEQDALFLSPLLTNCGIIIYSHSEENTRLSFGNGKICTEAMLRDIRGRATGVCPDARRGEGPQEMQSRNYDIGR